jgi:hypothetical protein
MIKLTSLLLLCGDNLGVSSLFNSDLSSVLVYSTE